MNNFKHGTLNYDVVNVVEGVVFVVVIDDDLYRYEVVVMSSFLERLKNKTALLRHKRLVWSLRETEMTKRYDDAVSSI